MGVEQNVGGFTEADKLTWQTKQFGNPQLGDSVLDALHAPSKTALTAEKQRVPNPEFIAGDPDANPPIPDQIDQTVNPKFGSVEELVIATSKHRDHLKDRADGVHVPPPPVVTDPPPEGGEGEGGAPLKAKEAPAKEAPAKAPEKAEKAPAPKADTKKAD